MAADLGPESAGARADGSSPGEARALTGHAWLAALPDELAAQRRVMARLADRCGAWPSVTSLLVGCSLGRGAADALSDIDAALGVDAPCGEAGAERVRTVEAMVVAALPELGALVDVLRHRNAASGQRIFAQFADRTQLDLTVVTEAEIQMRRRSGGAPDFIPLYQASATPDFEAPDALTSASSGGPGESRPGGSPPGCEPPSAYAVTGDQVREWAFLGWCALIDADKYLRRGSLWEAHNRLHEARHHIWALWAAARGALYHGMACRRCLTTTQGICRRASNRPSPALTPRTCDAPRARAPKCSPWSAPPPPGGIRPTSRRRWPTTSPRRCPADPDGSERRGGRAVIL